MHGESASRPGRSTITFLCCVAAMPVCARLLEGVHAESLEISLLAGVLLGAFYLLLRPVLRVLTLPIGCLTMGLFGMVIDMGLIWALDYFVDGFTVDGIWWMFLCAVLVNGMCLITGGAK